MPIPFAIPQCRIGSCVEQHSHHLTVEVRLDDEVGRCPACGQTSRAVHSRYHRHPADLPISTSRTTLNIEVRRFYCSNPCCSRRTFAEQASDLVAPRARRTRRLAETQGRVGIVCGGAPGARLLTHLRMPASRVTVLRLVRAMPMPDAPAPTHVGVDDWAMRKGCSYGTIVVDLDRHRVIDLLPDRTAATLAGWLLQRPDIEVVARDRSTEYARGASLGAPRAVQVDDRWHLLANMRQAVERWLHGVRVGLRCLPPVPGPTTLASGRDRAFPRTASEREAGAESRERWRAAYDEVRRRHADGQTLLGIAHAMGLARATVRKYAVVDTFPARLPHGPGPSLLDPHVDYLLGRIGEGCENAMALWREIRERGYPGTSRQVHRFVAERRTKPTPSGRKARGETMPVPETPAAEPSLPSARQLAWLLVQPTSALDAIAAAVVARVEQDATASAVAALARRFTALVRASGVGRTATPGRNAAADFDAWITTAKVCSAPAIATFASGLDGDVAAVRSALTEPWSSGQAEGQINRLKLIKRQSYGRAGLDLLQRRMVLAA
ncbi:ISL3 family transposase [Lichenibacterium ramalinae]|uniref:ISL3 family transposase n=1 Tax=Lichenibacterium ramalinae TaxID=2316527 RepID=A0A4Q2R6J0_9HYPH|nr:ISL3 family transposase [Lichenibacterium ramalinae]RYB01313.1 ISL3 family transposase [Lichenibacterium ramalinae]